MSSQGYYFRDSCRLCNGKALQRVIELSPTPPGNDFVEAAERDVPQAFYPLEVYFCNDCAHVQLGHVVDPEILYRRNYSYVSATSAVFVDHLRRYAAHMQTEFDLPAGSLVVDIGSNDGTALGFFKEAGFRVVGVDPATEIAQLARDRGIETVCEFFGSAHARKWRDEYGPAQLITSHNACAHIDDLRDVVEGVKLWLADDGLFVIEVGYLLDIVENAWFDTIYHEHLDYHSFAPLAAFFSELGMQVIDVQRISPQGGSIRVITQKAGGSRQVKESVPALMALEKRAGLDRAETFVDFDERINLVKRELRELVNGLKSEGKSIAGYGAPTKATTLLTHFELGSVLDFLADDNPLKQGLFSPGHHIPVVAADEMYARRPDFVLILAWNFAESIMQQHQRYRDQGGRFILPMPEPRIVS
jgi:SAM-dependent methyltransferase